MTFRPLHDRVVIKLVDEETRTRGGIIIPETAQEKPMEGEIDGVSYLIMKDTDILGVIQTAAAARAA